MKNEADEKCSFCGEIFESKKAFTGPNENNKFICFKCVKAVDLKNTPDGLSKHPSLC